MKNYVEARVYVYKRIISPSTSIISISLNLHIQTGNKVLPNDN